MCNPVPQKTPCATHTPKNPKDRQRTKEDQGDFRIDNQKEVQNIKETKISRREDNDERSDEGINVPRKGNKREPEGVLLKPLNSDGTPYVGNIKVRETHRCDGGYKSVQEPNDHDKNKKGRVGTFML